MIFNKTLWNKYTLSWYLLDVGSSFTAIVGLLYFSQWIVVDNGIKEIWYTLPTILATILLILSSTHVGWLGDTFGKHFKHLKVITITALLSMACLLLSAYFLGHIGVWLALLFFLIYMFMSQLVSVPYYSFIKTLVPESMYGKLSGIGMAGSQIGSVLGVLVALPILHVGGFSGNPRIDVFTVMLLLYALCAIPSLRLLKHKNPIPYIGIEKQNFKNSLRNGYIEASKYKGVIPVLLSFYLFSDAIQTSILYFGLFLEKVLHVNDTVKSYMYLVITLGFSIGALLSGWLSDRYNRKKVLVYWLLPNAISIFLVAIVSDVKIAFVLYFILGVTIGGVFTASRSYLASLIPPEKQGTIFGLYTFSERAASIMGPVIWLIVIALIPGVLGYRVALAVLAVCTLTSIIPLIYKKRELHTSVENV